MDLKVGVALRLQLPIHEFSLITCELSEGFLRFEFLQFLWLNYLNHVVTQLVRDFKE